MAVNSSKVFIDACVANANVLGVQMVIDYWPQPYGRAWRCDRMDWQVYQKETVSRCTRRRLVARRDHTQNGGQPRRRKSRISQGL
jgi:hypothetical protein